MGGRLVLAESAVIFRLALVLPLGSVESDSLALLLAVSLQAQC